MRSAVILFFCSSISFAQYDLRPSDLPLDTLARVGTSVISARDFLERYELMPWPHKDKVSRSDSTKLEFLQSMVAEKLLAIEASAQNIGNDSSSLDFQRNLERMFVRDELYKQRVLPHISVSDGELQEGLRRYPYEVEAEMLGIVTKKEGEMLRKKVLQSRNKHATFKRYNDSLFVILDTIRVTFGSAEKMVEDVLFSIGKDSISRPVEMDSRHAVMFRLLKKSINVQNSKLSHSDRLHKVGNIIKQRKQDSLAMKTFAAVTSPQTAEADPDIFIQLADAVLSILKADSANYWSNGMYKFPSAAINLLEKQFSAFRSRLFITIASGNMTLGEVLLGLSNNNVFFPSLDIEQIRSVLNKNIKTVIQNELLAREGLKQNLQQSNTVRRDVATWMDSRKSWLLTRSVIDTVHILDEEIESEYRTHPKLYGASMLVRVREILVDSLPLAVEIKKDLDNGKDFPTLATRYSKRTERSGNGGESSWFDIAQYGELGSYASTASVGEWYGPLKLKDGYTVFSVIERKIADDSWRTDLAGMKRSIGQKLLAVKQQKTLDKYIGTLAKKYNVSMNETALYNVKTLNSTMVTWRNIGFGGRIVAVPQMIPQTEWVNEWIKQQQLNQ